MLRELPCAGPGRLRRFLCRVGLHRTYGQLNPYFARCESCGKVVRDW